MRRRPVTSECRFDASSLADSTSASAMLRRRWKVRPTSVGVERRGVRRAVAADAGLVILSDTGDSVYGGAPGDNTCLLRELLAQQLLCVALVPVIDTAAVDAAMSAGV